MLPAEAVIIPLRFIDAVVQKLFSGLRRLQEPGSTSGLQATHVKRLRMHKAALDTTRTLKVMQYLRLQCTSRHKLEMRLSEEIWEDIRKSETESFPAPPMETSGLRMSAIFLFALDLTSESKEIIIFSRSDVAEIINLQPKGSDAKAYQIKQVRNIVVKYRLGETDVDQI
jgi:hypothetical protein